MEPEMKRVIKQLDEILKLDDKEMIAEVKNQKLQIFYETLKEVEGAKGAKRKKLAAKLRV